MNAIVNFRKCTLSDADLLKEVDRLTDEMYQTGKVPSRQIPARPDKDYDLLVDELVVRFYDKIVKPQGIVSCVHCKYCSREITFEEKYTSQTPMFRAYVYCSENCMQSHINSK